MFRRTCWLFVLLLLTQVGCRHPWFRKGDSACPPPPPPGAPFLSPAPGGFGGIPAPQGDVLMPAPYPPAGAAPAPVAPPPAFPGTPSNFPPIASFYPPGTTAPPSAATVPPIRLLPPETATQPPAAGLSESASAPTASATPPLPVGIPNFTPALADRVANGRKPALDGLDWLQANGYKAALFVHRPGMSDAGDRKQFEQRGLKFMSLEVEPASLTWDTVDVFARAVSDPSAQPLFVYDADGSLTGGLWYLYFRRIERLPDEAARLRAGRLGWREGAEGPHRAMAEAAQKLNQQY